MMNKKELIISVAQKTGLSQKDSDAALSAVTNTITAALSREEKVRLDGFGSFKVKERAARIGRNPKTKEQIDIPATKTVVFNVSKNLKAALGRDESKTAK